MNYFMACTRTLVFQCQVCVFSVMTKAFHKLLEIFQKVSRNFSKSKNFFGSDAEIYKLYNRSKISKHFCAIFGVKSVAK